MEWFDRVTGELQDHLESFCEKYDQTGFMSVERGARHPRIEFFIETEEFDRDYFCTLNFDPYNEEFYMDSFEPDLGQRTKIIMLDIEDIVDAVHESFHDFLNENNLFVDEGNDEDTDEEYIIENNDGEDFEIIDKKRNGEDHSILEEIDVEWETPEVTAYVLADEVEVTYQFGIVQETGDGVLRRINRVWTPDDELIKDETNFIFSKEEASTIIAMIASHMDSLSEMDADYQY